MQMLFYLSVNVFIQISARVLFFVFCVFFGRCLFSCEIIEKLFLIIVSVIHSYCIALSSGHERSAIQNNTEIL